MSNRPKFVDGMNRQRLRDVQEALRLNHGMGSLSRKWGISRPGATQWCRAHIPADDRKRLSDNGTATIGDCRRSFDLVSRLELVALCRRNGWSDARTADAIGVAPPGLSVFLQRHAPDGLEQAIADYRDDEPTQQSAAA